MIARDRATVTASPAARCETVVTNRRVTIGLGSRRFYMGVQSSHYYRPGHDDHRGSVLWRSMGYVGCASLAFCLVFASGGVLRAAPMISGYAVVLPIDDKPAPVAPRHKAKPRRTAPTASTAMPASTAIAADAADWSVDPAFDVAGGEPLPATSDTDIATLPTTDGERAVAVYGPSRRVGGKSCRDVSVFVRGTDGRISVSPSVQCEAAR